MKQKKWAYYNEIDPNAAEWIRQLIRSGQVTDGEVDERSIEDVTPSDVIGFKRVHWFAGIAGWDYALRLAGWPDDRPVWTGSAPCQPFSAAGKGGGTADERHLWPALFWLISQCRPETVFGEQVASKDGLGWWDIVSADLEGAGYACGANDLCAPGVGAFHIRQRLYWVGSLEVTQGYRGHGPIQPKQWGEISRAVDASRVGSTLANADSPRRQWQGQTQSAGRGHNPIALGGEQVSPLADAEHHGHDRPGTHEAQQGSDGTANGLSIGGDRGLCSPSPLAHPESAKCQCTGRARAGRARLADRRPWDNPIWLPCADGKARPAQRSIFPLVAGLPRGVGYSGDISPQTAQNTAEGRVMRLKGYGNAIVPQLAAEFVGAAMEFIQSVYY